MKLSYRRQHLRTRHRFATSGWEVDEKDTLVVTLEHGGLTGFGECVPSELYGQSLEASEAAIAAMDAELIDDPFALEPNLNRLLARHDDQRAAVAGVESALYDWYAKRLGIPVWRLLGLARPRQRTTFTIGVATPDIIRVKVQEALADGFDSLKVKVGTPQDHETLSIVRSVFDGPLFVDANGGWQPDEAAACIRELARYQPAVIEQPLPPDCWEEMAALRGLRVAPIIADESCQRPADVLRLQGCVDGINIKFTKCGGIREAMHMITLARALEMKVMLGCFVCSSLAIAPALSVSSLVDYADLDGHLLLANDPFEGIERNGGTLSLTDEPGLGVRPRDAALPGQG